MTNICSYTKHEHEVLPKYRKQLNTAESNEEVKKFFSYTMQDLVQKASDGRISPSYGDIILEPECKPHYRISTDLQGSDVFNDIWESSDMPAVFARLAESAAHRYTHLARPHNKSETKIKQH